MFRKRLGCVVAGSLFIFITACGSDSLPGSTSDKGDAPWGKADDVASQYSAPITLTLLHTNDTHSQLESFQPFEGALQGGVARRKTAIEQVRAQLGPEQVITVDAGDFFQGTIFFNAWKGSSDIMALNDMSYDVVNLGNHEFDLGPQELLRALTGGPVEIAGSTYQTEALAMPVVSTNLVLTSQPALSALIKPSVVLERAGQKIGFIGVITEMMATPVNPYPTVSATDYLTTVQAEVSTLEAAGINKIVLLSHSGWDLDVKMAQQLAGVDVIVSGHDHALLLDPADVAAGAPLESFADKVRGDYPTVVTSADGGTTLVVSAFNAGSFLGRIDVDFDADGAVSSWGGEPIFIDESYVEDPALQGKVASYKDPVDLFASAIIGQAGMFFDGSRNPGVRTQEMPIGNLITDAIVEAVATHGAVAAVTNGGGIRNSMPGDIDPSVDQPPYDITFGDALAVLPFTNTIVVLDVTGEELVRALDTGLMWGQNLGIPFKSSGSFPQVSGMNVSYCGATVYDIQNPTNQCSGAGTSCVTDEDCSDGETCSELPWTDCKGAMMPGGVITAITVGGSALQLDATYRIATNNYLSGGGDFYTPLAEACARESGFCLDTGMVMLDALAAELETSSPVKRAVEGRLLAQ